MKGVPFITIRTEPKLRHDRCSLTTTVFGLPRRQAATTTTKAPLPIEVKDCGDEGVLVTGAGTFKAKAVLAGLGGSWSKSLKAWVFAAGTTDAVRSGLEASTAPRLAVTVLGATLDGVKGDLDAARTDALNATVDEPVELSMGAHKKAVVVRGPSKPLTGKLRALGGSWNRGLGGWIFPKKDATTVVAALRADPNVTVDVDAELDVADEASPSVADDVSPSVAEPKSSSKKRGAADAKSKAASRQEEEEEEEEPAERATRKQKLSLWSLSPSQTGSSSSD